MIMAHGHTWVQGSKDPIARVSGYKWVHGSHQFGKEEGRSSLGTKGLSAASSYQILIPRKEPLAVGPGLAYGHEHAGRFMVPRSPCSWNHGHKAPQLPKHHLAILITAAQ